MTVSITHLTVSELSINSRHKFSVLVGSRRLEPLGLTCCVCAVFKAPCLDVSSAGMGRLHASSILGSILLLFCRLLGCGLHN